MTTLKINIRFLSDAELGSGFGTEALNGLVPRDGKGSPIIPAPHLKGLIRDRLEELAALRDWPRHVLDAVLGEPGENGTDGRTGKLRIGGVSPVGEKIPPVVHVSRTAVSRTGTAVPGSLRTVESIAADSEFTGSVWVEDVVGSTSDLLVRLGLMSIEALGGGRTRGAGLCRIAVENESRKPGELLRELDQKVKQTRSEEAQPLPTRCGTSACVLVAGRPAWFRLVFRAESGVCCPEIPINGSTNHIRSGPVVPASAVQGVLLTRLSTLHPSMATACLFDERFRAWPLTPVLLPGTESIDGVPFGTRVDLTHRISKLQTASGRYDVRDAAIEPYHWSDLPGGSPLKSCDGILRRHTDGTVTLWRTGDLPRLLSSHSVHWSGNPGEKRSLFSVESLAPMVFSGLVAIPAEAADLLRQVLEKDPSVAFGKARSVRGYGMLELCPIGEIDDFLSTELPAELPGRVFIVQSPLALPDEQYPIGCAETALQTLAENAGWGRVVLKSQNKKGHDIARTSATCGVRFGWNRHGFGTKADPRHQRLRARRVILPGSVLVLEEPLFDVAGKLLTGLGDGRTGGFGALLPHPGIASTRLYRPDPSMAVIRSQNPSGKRALDLFQKAGEGRGPSPSQIAAVARRIGSDASAYLEQQAGRGGVRHWQRWAPILDEVKCLVTGDAGFARRVLRVWQDLMIIHREDNREDS